jgi:hypothetical protein
MLKKERKVNKNLLKYSIRSSEEARVKGTKGGIKSGIVRQADKTFREAIGILLDETEKHNGRKVSNRMAVALAMIKESVRGNVQAAVFLRDTMGEKPVEKKEIALSDPPVIVDDIK